MRRMKKKKRIKKVGRRYYAKEGVWSAHDGKKIQNSNIIKYVNKYY